MRLTRLELASVVRSLTASLTADTEEMLDLLVKSENKIQTRVKVRETAFPHQTRR